ncbi:MAG: ammonium transporter [Candidatus Sulfotelmatobacter sp.]
MTTPSLAAASDASTVLCTLLVLMVPMACAGLALVNTGIGRSRSGAHAMLSSLCVLSIAAIVYVIFGFSSQGAWGRPAHAFILGGKPWSWIAAEPVFLRGLPFDLSPLSLTVLLQIFSVSLAAFIPLSAGADRWRLGAICGSTALLAGVSYPLFAHWAWGGGWLAQLGVNYGLGSGFMDAGGSGTIQVVGGLTALSITWILRPRSGKYSLSGPPAAIPAHNIVLVLLGCLIAWLGWLGLNSSGAILFSGVAPSQVILIAVNTTLSAAASALTAATVTRIRFGRPDASLVANAWMGGLVASSASAPFLKPAAAILVGAIAGALVPLAVDLLESRLGIDDPGGAVSVHAIAGVWGLCAVAALSNVGTQNGARGQWLAQLVGIATLLGFVLPLTYGLNWLLDRVYRQRVDVEGEWRGMDLHELGAGAYPEFVVHSDDFIQS